ncbi:MAG: hypothetical protein ALECFALPRED_005146 [Alectoria fallacina]|uniref:LysM domain-containing protein n=1 Tax=Alectoria fallacina TaxID=1903189 RepID=A0A8H3FZG7_9LECA|nr:MAG: hypothetical protein ALECFALPRED_005146 [Alectoria fallacina]
MSSTHATCLSGIFYTVALGDDCQKIAVAKQVATGTLRIINNILPDCSNLIAGAQVCIPQPCTTYLVQPNDTCWSIASANNIYASNIIAYNPSINPDCTNLLSGESVCLSPAGGVYTPTFIAGATVTQTGSYASATVSAPGPIPYGTTAQCGKYYQCNPGDNCQQISLNTSITLSLFEAINPNINAGCSNLMPGFYYCVFPTQDWNATASTSNGTMMTSVYVTAPAPTPTDTTSSCYAWHVVVSGDTCAKIETSYGITFAQFQDWNPSIDTACSKLLLSEAYCVSGPGSSSISSTAKATAKR